MINTLILIVSIVAIVISVITLILQRQSEVRALRISFLLPELSQIIDALRSYKVKKVENGKPDAESMEEFYIKYRDICFRKEHIFKSIGLSDYVNAIICGKEYNEPDPYRKLSNVLDERYQQLVGQNNKL